MRPPNPEEGITNLGPVPEGMSFIEATHALAGERRFIINPRHHSGRMTICETMREIWRLADRAGNEDIKALAAAGFDYGKRMNARMVELRCSRS